ncbi:hypothetical protein ACFFMN_33750 [Planobispora siamensis]|uniref:Uncharacterized protein n=1 Tax=Planobispora siamensis TaxID=936338 RepID=A0A8J3WIP0_9ACTN|nr:hypothetical protein [Planobispora siamensis]GIH91984.1 hypothetical protein Psi01_26140 [Planobispora siamensis]
MNPIDQSILADYAARLLDTRTDWDIPHEFHTLHWDGERLRTGTLTMIDPSVPPSAYPHLMASTSGKEAAEQCKAGERTLYGYALIVEAHSVKEPADPSPEEAARFTRDRIERRFHERPDAVEIAGVHLVDIHDRMWVATRERASGKVEHHFYPDKDGAPGGPLIAGLRMAAYATASIVWGIR